MKTHMKIKFLLFLLLSFFEIKAQTNTLYTPGNNISSSLINDLYQDKDGFIWITTEYGLNRFDGNKFTVYKHDENDTTSICNNYTKVIFEDKENNIWVGTLTGLMKFNKGQNNFSNIPLYINNKMSTQHISNILETRNNEILIATSNQGLFKISSDGKYGMPIQNIYKSEFTDINTILEDKKGNIWIGSNGKGVGLFNTDNNTIENISDEELKTGNVTSLAMDDNGNIFIGTFNSGLFVYKEKSNKIEKICNITNMKIKDMKFIDRKLYIGTDGNGIKLYDNEKNEIQDFTINNSSIDFTNAKIHSILHDRTGNIWLGIFQKGVMFIHNGINAFKTLGGNKSNPEELEDGCVMSICNINSGETLVGIDSKGLFLLNSEFKVKRHYKPEEKKNGVPGTILTIFEDYKNNIWIGSYGKGISKFNKETGECQPIEELKNENVFSIAEGKDKKLYISTYGSGLYVYNQETNELYSFKNNHTKDCIPDNWINSLYCDREGFIWIGHFKGVSCFNPKTQSFINFTNDNFIIKDKLCYSITESRTKIIWIGTSEGLYSFNKSNGKISRYGISDGLPNDVICSIKEDFDGNLWITTFNGLCKYDNINKNFTCYYKEDGLQGNEFTRGASCKTNNGNIMFGGTNGITYFNPTFIKDSMTKPNIKISDFEIAGKKVNSNTVSGNKKIINKELTKADTFNLSHKDNTFRVVFTTLDFGNTSHIYYKYRIKQLDNKWLSTRFGENYITFNNIPSGKYTLEVYAINRNITSDLYTYTINIAYPWYQTWWAYILFSIPVIIFIGLIINFIREKFERKKELLKIEHAKEINEAKLQFFINISHEIRTPMTLIINPLEKLISSNTDVEKGKTYMMIYRNAQRILRLINQLMDIRKIEKGQMTLKFSEVDMVDFINDLMLTFENTAKQKNISFNFTSDNPKEYVWIDVNNFDKVIMNLLSNAFKYTQDNGNISVFLRTGENQTLKGPLKNYIEIQVKDNGIGLDESTKEHIFERFYQISGNGIHNKGGTGVGLHLTRSIVEMHYGTITAENNKDESGCVFTVRIPQGCNHIHKEQIETNCEFIKDDINNQPIAPLLVNDKNEDTKKRTKTNLTILIVDDEKEIQEYLKDEFSDEYKIAIANNGKEAYEYILQHKTDLVISDVMMDVMDGLTLCKKIKQNTNTNHIPVILLTAKGKVEDQIDGIEHGADTYIVKPFNTEILRSTISNLLHNRRILKNKYNGSQEQEEKIQEIKLKSADEALMEKIMNYINKNIAEPSLNVEMLAQEVGLSRVHLHRKMKELTNFSTRDFIKNIRMRQAAKLFKEKKLNISEVAYAVGYNNLSHFSSTFKETYGVSPKEFIVNNMNDDNI